MRSRFRRRVRVMILAAPLVVGAAALLLHGPIPQDLGYLNFADRRSWAGIPNAGDVLSNFAFFFAGGLGLAFVGHRRGAPTFLDPTDRLAFVLFFAGVFLTAFGSAWFHLQPDLDHLAWDRLPMTVSFMSFFSAMIAERVHPRLASRLLWPLLAFGIGSVFYWRATERVGRGDLRPYALVQYYPMIAIVLLFLLYPPRYTHSAMFWGVAFAYAAAKLFEILDEPILRATGVVSGHTLKHLTAGGAAGLLVWMLARRRPVERSHCKEDP